MKIALDLSQINRDGAGVNNYWRGLLGEFALQTDHNFLICLREDQEIGLDLPPHFQKIIIPSVPKFLGGGFTWYFLLGKRLRKLKADVLVEATMNVAPLFFPTLEIIHDISPVTHPETFDRSLRWRFGLSLWVTRHFASQIATVTQTTKQAFLAEYSNYKKEIKVTNEGLAAWTKKEVDTQLQQGAKTKLSLPERYFLSLGTVQPRKNYKRAIRAFARARGKNSALSNYHYVIGGGKGWLYKEILQEATRLGVQDYVKFLGFVDESDLPHVFDLASGFMQLSLDEGFGLPLIEARARSLPILCSDIPVFKEIKFDISPIMVNPKNTDEIAAGIIELATKTKVEPSQALLKHYSWDRVASRVLNVAKEIETKSE